MPETKLAVLLQEIFADSTELFSFVTSLGEDYKDVIRSSSWTLPMAPCCLGVVILMEKRGLVTVDLFGELLRARPWKRERIEEVLDCWLASKIRVRALLGVLEPDLASKVGVQLRRGLSSAGLVHPGQLLGKRPMSALFLNLDVTILEAGAIAVVSRPRSSAAVFSVEHHAAMEAMLRVTQDKLRTAAANPTSGPWIVPAVDTRRTQHGAEFDYLATGAPHVLSSNWHIDRVVYFAMWPGTGIPVGLSEFIGHLLEWRELAARLTALPREHQVELVAQFDLHGLVRALGPVPAIVVEHPTEPPPRGSVG